MGIFGLDELTTNKEADEDGASHSALKVPNLIALMEKMAKPKTTVIRYCEESHEKRMQTYVHHNFLIVAKVAEVKAIVTSTFAESHEKE